MLLGRNKLSLRRRRKPLCLCSSCNLTKRHRRSGKREPCRIPPASCSQPGRHISWTEKTVWGIRMLPPALDCYHLALFYLGASLSHHWLAHLGEQLAPSCTAGHCCHPPVHPLGSGTFAGPQPAKHYIDLKPSHPPGNH